MTAASMSKARLVPGVSRSHKKTGRAAKVRKTGSVVPMAPTAFGSGSAQVLSSEVSPVSEPSKMANTSEAENTIVVAGTRVPASFAGRSRSAFARAMLAAVRWYQVHISAGNPPCCKYYPSCSNYAIQAVTRYGALRGGLLALLRLLRCRPWSNGGIDDVPQHYSIFYRFSWSKAHEEPRLTPLASDVKETA